MSPTSSIGAWALEAGVTWRYRLDVPPVSMHAAPDDSFLLVADVFGTVRSLETATGEVRWERTFGMNNVHSVRATLDGSTTVLLEEGRLLRLDGAGQDVWEASVGALRSAFDVNASGTLVALSAAVHEIEGGEVRIGSKVTLYGEEGKWLEDVAVDHAVTRMSFTSERGDLVCTSPEGHVTFLKDRKIGKQTNLGSALDGLVSCLDGSLILMPAGGDGIHVLSAAMQSLGVLSVSGSVEDVDVSEDGSSILVKERDGLIYLLNGAFDLRWRGRMERPVLRVDLAGDGSFAYIAESTGEVLRVDFKPNERHGESPLEPTEDTRELTPTASVELGGIPIRAGLGRMAWLGADVVSVLPRPSQLLLVAPGAPEPISEKLPFHAAHVTADPNTSRLAVWSNRRLSLVNGDGAVSPVSEQSIAAVAFTGGGELVVGTASGELHRYDAAGEPRWKVRIGAGVIGVAQATGDGPLIVLCADGAVVVVNPEGEKVATRELSAPAIAHPDVVAEADGAGGPPQTEQDFWSHYGRAYQLVMTPLGPVLYHGGGRILLLGLDGEVVHESHVGQELSSVHPMGEQLFVVEATGVGAVLGADLAVQRRFALSSREARPALLAGAPVIADRSPEALLLRDLDGAVVAQHALYPAPRALAVSPDGAHVAVVLDTQLKLFDLSA